MSPCQVGIQRPKYPPTHSAVERVGNCPNDVALIESCMYVFISSIVLSLISINIHCFLVTVPLLPCYLHTFFVLCLVAI